MASIYGDNSNNTLSGTGFNDDIHGGGGNDLLYGYGGNDSLYGGSDSGLDTLIGGYGNDNLHGGDGNDWLRGEWDNDNLYGDNGNDNLIGGLGNDYLNGGAGNDILDGFWYSANGNGEVDRLRGDSGWDTFVIGDWYGKGYLGNSWAVIEDFNWQEDYIKVQGNLSQYDFRSGSAYGYSSNDTAIVLKNNPNEVLAIALNVSTANNTIQLTSRDFLAT